MHVRSCPPRAEPSQVNAKSGKGKQSEEQNAHLLLRLAHLLPFRAEEFAHFTEGNIGVLGFDPLAIILDEEHVC